jgi:fucose 4-O-acetylase-like acetyltransferase
MGEGSRIMASYTANSGLERLPYWDMVKGLGIIAIVVGHGGGPLKPYVYLYHLALFFFVSGFLYKERYSSDPFHYFSTRMERLWWPWVKYGVLFAMLHNVFLMLGLYSSRPGTQGVEQTNPFGLLDYFMAVKKVVLMQNVEQIGGARWFILPLFRGMIIFCCIQNIAGRTDGWKRQSLSFMLIMACGAFGVYLAGRHVMLEYHTNVSFLVLPIIYGGFLARRYWDSVPMKWYYGLLSAGILALVYKMTGTILILGEGKILGPKLFYIVSFTGIYLNLYLAHLLGATKWAVQLLAYLGRNSFHIMALHLLAFRFVSSYQVFIYNKPAYLIARYPLIDRPGWWIIYTTAGLFVPVVLVEIYKRLPGKVSAMFRERKATVSEGLGNSETA